MPIRERQQIRSIDSLVDVSAFQAGVTEFDSLMLLHALVVEWNTR